MSITRLVVHTFCGGGIPYLVVDILRFLYEHPEFSLHDSIALFGGGYVTLLAQISKVLSKRPGEI